MPERPRHGIESAPTIGIIGLGVIGHTLVKASRIFDPQAPRLIVSTRRQETLEALAATCPGLQAASNRKVAEEAGMVFLCVPPGAYLAVLDQIADCLGPGKILVSVTNGVALPDIEQRVACPVVKLIPTIAHAVGRGVSLLARGARSGDAEVEAVARFLRPFGRVVEVDPADMRAATNITGCGPALVACFGQALAQASARRIRGLSPALVEQLVTETIVATGRLLESGSTCPSIIEEAATGGGMTQVAVRTLAENLPELMQRVIQAIEWRERELQDGQARSAWFPPGNGGSGAPPLGG